MAEKPIYNLLFSPLLSMDPEKTRVSKTLHAILLTLMAGSLGIVVLGIIFAFMRYVALAGTSLVFFITMFICHRAGYIRFPAFFTCLYLIGIATYSIYTGDGLHDVAIILFPAFLLTGSLLLNRKLFYFLGIMSVAAVGLVGIAEMYGVVENDYSFGTTVPDLLLALILLASTGILIRILTAGLVRALEDSRKSEESYRAIFNAPSEAIFIHDAETGKILDVNDTMLLMYGFKKSEIEGLTVGHISEGTVPFSQADAQARIQTAREEGPQLFLWRSRRKDGSLFWTEVALRVATIGGYERVLAVVRDVDEKKHMEEELKQSEKMQVIGQLAGGIAHDFNNQLGGIIGFAEILSTELKSDTHRRYCSLIVSSAESAAKLNKKLLGFARKGKSDKRPLDINVVVKEAIAVLTHSVDKRIEIAERLSSELLPVRGDAAQLQNALLNLGINARDAMPGGGTIELATERVFLDDSFLSQYPVKLSPGNFALIAVTDTGVGIPKAVQERMYEPFFTTKEVGKGTGMGLSGVYATVKDHGGIIACYSEINQGTVFKLYLPFESASEESTAEETEDLSPYRGKETILLIDDEPTILDLGEKILSDLGYTIRTFDSPLAAIVFYKNHVKEIDLVVLDMVMPKSDGYDTYRKLKSANPKLKAVVCSGFSERQKAEGILALGASSFVSKPFRRVDLAKAVYAALHE